MRLLLICHAEGMQNRYSALAQRVEPTADSGLTAYGWEQTSQLAQWLATHETIDVLVGRLVDGLRRSLPLDAVFLSLHGAAASEKCDDVEGYVLAAVVEASPTCG